MMTVRPAVQHSEHLQRLAFSQQKFPGWTKAYMRKGGGGVVYISTAHVPGNIMSIFSYPSLTQILRKKRKTYSRKQIKHATAAAKSLQSCPTLCGPIEPTRLPRPWDSPGKNTGVGCHFLLQCMKVKGEGEEPRWRRSRTGRTLSPPQIHQKSI